MVESLRGFPILESITPHMEILMRGKLARNLRRKSALERMKKQLEQYYILSKEGIDDVSSIKIKTKGIKKKLSPTEVINLKIARMLMAIEPTESKMKG